MTLFYTKAETVLPWQLTCSPNPGWPRGALEFPAVSTVLVNRDVHFGTRPGASIHPIAFLRSAGIISLIGGRFPKLSSSATAAKSFSRPAARFARISPGRSSVAICRSNALTQNFHLGPLNLNRIFRCASPVKCFGQFFNTSTPHFLSKRQLRASDGQRKRESAVFPPDSRDTFPFAPFLRRSIFLRRNLVYPVGTARASIRRTMLPNSRRVRWLSASISQ